MGDATAGTVRLIGGDPSLDFVNTVGGRAPLGGSASAPVLRDKLRGYADLVVWARHAGLVEAAVARRLATLAARHPAAAAAVLKRAVLAREGLYRILSALMGGGRPDPRDIAALNAELAEARSHERLVTGAGGLRWEPDSPQRRLESVLEPVLKAAAALLTSAELVRLRQCAGEDCGWLFLDRSRNRRRQWCTMEDCGNLAKVRRFRQRQRRAATPSRARP